MIWRILRWLDWRKRGVKAWWPSNIYRTATLGDNVSVGRFAEIGSYVTVGSDSRIGKGTFIPEGVLVGKGVFIGPHVTFTNDMYPPSPKGEWQGTLVGDKASIGAGVTIRPGVTIGSGALVGAGSTVTKNVPAGETWVGNPAHKVRSAQGEKDGN
jgi:acetyltransferase-like isoleucine patch superfamily enzyme